MHYMKITWMIVLSSLILIGCSPTAQIPDAKENFPAKVTGTVTYLQRITLPSEAVIRVTLEDVSRVDIVAERIGEHIIMNPGQVPVPFVIGYDPAIIDPRHFYAIKVRITAGNQLLFINTSAYHVITHGNPTTVDVVVQPVN